MSRDWRWIWFLREYWGSEERRGGIEDEGYRRVGKTAMGAGDGSARRLNGFGYEVC